MESAPSAPVVLLVDDDDVHSARLIDALGLLSLERLDSGAAAIERLQRSPVPTAMILDLAMSGIDGWSVYREMRRSPELAGVRVIVTTAAANFPEVPLAGIAAFIRKPSGEAAWPDFVSALKHAIEGLNGPPVNYAIRISDRMRQRLDQIPPTTRAELYVEISRAAMLPAPSWAETPGKPVVVLRAPPYHLRVELDAARRLATVIALFDPARGWAGDD